MIKKVYNIVKKEILSILPAFLFCLIAFTILNFTENLFLKNDLISTNYNFIGVFFFTAITAKVLIAANHLPFINLFPGMPLIFNIIWKTAVYESLNACVRVLIRVYEINSFSQGFLLSMKKALVQIDFYKFLAVQIWYVIFFFIFITADEIIRVLGKEKIRKLFFGF
jgi:hypothetical protein